MTIDLIYFTPEIRCCRVGRVERLFRGSWQIIANTDNHGGYNRIKINGKMIYRHRIIAFCFLGLNIDDPSEIVDHEDRDKLNNAVNNLRIVTNQQNQFNRNAKGYCWHKASSKWKAQIKINGVLLHLGLFDNEADASKAYQDAKLIHHLI
jgi:hypothetical protein